MSKGNIFYLLAFITIVGSTMVNRYLWEMPSSLFLLFLAIGFVFVFFGQKARGEKMNWDFDFSPKGTTSRSRRKKQNRQ